MCLSHMKRCGLVCIQPLLCHQLSPLAVNRSTRLCLSPISQSFVNHIYSYIKSNNKININKNSVYNQNKQTFEPKVSKNRNNFLNKSRTEETIDFDPQFGDTFGALGYESKFKRLSAEELAEDDDNYDVLDIKRGPKMAEIGYKKQLNELINKKPIQMRKALQLYNQMVSEDRIPPDKCTYTLLITGCAKVGYTEKAFQLFDQLLKYELRPTKPTLTALFNACAECPFPEYGLEKARHLREWMRLQGFVANTLQYHSMIKAFGKLEDIRTAFEIVNEMVANGQTTTDETFAMLLIGCISNKESGLYEAIKVLRRMNGHNIGLTIYTFNLLLRAVRDCGLGSEDNLNSLIHSWGSPTHPMSSQNSSQKQSKTSTDGRDMRKSYKTSPSQRVGSDSKSLVARHPNILSNNGFNDTNIVEIKFDSLSLPSNRFMLLGGIEGFIKMMTDSGVRPNINTLTLMTELIDFREESEKSVLNLLDTFRIKADTDFFNILMKRMSRESGIIGAKRVLSLMTDRGLTPDIITFGVLSLSCNNCALGERLLKDMDALGIRPNVQIMGGLVSSACHSNDFSYINHLIDYMKANDINPNRKLVENLEIIKIKFQKIIANYDWNRSTGIPKRFESKRFRREFTLFKANYEEWLKSAELEEEAHPWHQFQYEEIPNKEKMHSFVKYMKQKIQKRRGTDVRPVVDEYEEDELYND